MIAILGSLIGFLTSIFPEILKMHKDKHDRQHELDILDRQMKMARKDHQTRLEEINILSDTKIYQSLYQNAAPCGVTWVDALSSSVRPTITYAFFGLYSAIKVAMWTTYCNQGCSWSTALLSLWGMEDQALFATVLSFWFGHRLLINRKMAKAK